MYEPTEICTLAEAVGRPVIKDIADTLLAIAGETDWYKQLLRVTSEMLLSSAATTFSDTSNSAEAEEAANEINKGCRLSAFYSILLVKNAQQFLECTRKELSADCTSYADLYRLYGADDCVDFSRIIARALDFDIRGIKDPWNALGIKLREKRRVIKELSLWMS